MCARLHRKRTTTSTILTMRRCSEIWWSRRGVTSQIRFSTLMENLPPREVVDPRGPDIATALGPPRPTRKRRITLVISRLFQARWLRLFNLTLSRATATEMMPILARMSMIESLSWLPPRPQLFSRRQIQSRKRKLPPANLS